MILLVALYALLVGYMTARRTVYGVYIVLATLPSYLIRFSIGAIPSTLLEVSILTVPLVWFFKLPHAKIYTRAHTKKLFFSHNALTVWWYLTLAFICASTAAAVLSPARIPALGIWKAYIAEPLMFFAVCISTLRDTRAIRTALDFLFVGIGAAACVSIVQQFTGWGIPNPFWQAEATRRVTSLYGYPNAFPLLVAPLVPLMIEQIRTHANRAARGAYLLLIGATLLSVVFARSDGAIAGLAVAFLVAGLWYRRSRAYAVICAALIALTLAVSPLLRTQFANGFLFQGVSGRIRIAMWKETLQMLAAHPWQGGGLANYQTAVAPYHRLKWTEIYLYPHSIFLNAWTELGIAGLTSFVALIIWFVTRAALLYRVHHDPLMRALLFSMLILLVHGLVDVPYFRNDLAVVFWFMIALAVLKEKHLISPTY